MTVRMGKPPDCPINPTVKRAFGNFGGFTCYGGGSSATRDTVEKACAAWYEQYKADQARRKKP